jgi:hypothetical protein
MLDSDTLRILRIIVDIDIHYYKKSVDETVLKMKKYKILQTIEKALSQSTIALTTLAK